MNRSLMSKVLAFGSLGTLMLSCSVGLNGGSITGTFSGIQSAVVKGPTSVEINWTTNLQCTNYQIFQLSSSTTSSVANATVPPVVLTSPVIESDSTYNFSVGCVDTTGATSGEGVNQSVTTWAQFNGVVAASLDTTGTTSNIALNWTYGSNTGTVFQIFAQESQVPGDLSNWELPEPNGPGTAYTGTPICEVLTNSVNIGNGGNCPGANLISGNTYNFKVVALYPDGTYSPDLLGNGASIAVPASFTPPNCILSQIGIGSNSSTAALVLRCNSGGSSSSCALANISTTAYQAIGGVKTAISSTLNGAGILRIAPQVSTSGNTRQVNDLEIDYTCTSTTPPTISVVRYDGSNPNYPPPLLKYGNTAYEAAPPQSYANSPSYLGSAFAIGDFNCDGKPDLAVGLPQVSYNYPPYNNQNPQSGAVKIYYDYALTATGAITSTSTEYITFRDLPSYAHFGYSLSAGNINKDVSKGTSDPTNIYSCDDLIIGAPGAQNSGTYPGYAYIFYGQPQGLPQPLTSAGLSADSPTCTGNILNEVCAPVRLQPGSSVNARTSDMTTYFHIDPSMTGRNNNNDYGVPSMVGFSVAYIRDFNADGYGDVAIGDPYCSWDGESINNNQNASVYPPQPGCVYVYWGGPQGVQSLYVGKTPDDLLSLTSPFVKIYPPFPQDHMLFGWSISGGGDVDGRLPVPVLQNGGPAIILANGDDFVVGAPGFSYNDHGITPGANQEMGTSISNNLQWNVSESSPRSGCTSSPTCPVDPVLFQNSALSTYSSPDTIVGPKITAPLNGAWNNNLDKWNTTGPGFPLPTNANLLASTGIAFMYRGRSSNVGYHLGLSPSASGNFALMPNAVPSTLISSPPDNVIAGYFSNSLQARQNGSQNLIFYNDQAFNQLQAPLDSFYNCGPRGGPSAPSISSDVPTHATAVGTYKHISCLAGRNNFSVLYPTRNAVVTGFGTNVAIAGPAEQNAVALYQLGTIISSTDYEMVSQGLNTFVPFAQGNLHSGVRGTSLWEMGMTQLNTFGTTVNTCETTSDTSSSTALNAAAGCTGTNHPRNLARSIIDESYSNFSSTVWNPLPSATPIMDINKDGYADILITANNQLYTFFGNYAADFSYQDNIPPYYSTSANCTVTRTNTLTGGTYQSSSGFGATYAASTAPSPFSTFYTTVTGVVTSGTPSFTFQGEYPQFVLPDTGYAIRAAYLGDLAQQNIYTNNSGSAFNYPTGSITRATGLAACLPQVKTFPTGDIPSSLAVGDMNADGILDAITGLSNANSSNGLAVISTGSLSGGGLASDSDVTISASGSKFGTFVAGNNWKFIDESSRRDFFAGALGYNGGAGAIFNFNGAGNSVLSSVPNYQYAETSNAPNLLGAERSRIIGDINGDGFDDIWIPVKQIDSSGNVYFDALIYYGSAVGPITYTTCAAQASSITLLGGGGSISASDCLGTTTPQVAVLNGTQILLPQYVPRPTGVSPYWALYPFAAGDVNRDGYADLVFFDAQAVVDYTLSNTTTSNYYDIYLFFGSSSGIIDAQPTLGSSLNLAPQLVTQNAELAGGYGNGGSEWAPAGGTPLQQVNPQGVSFSSVPQSLFPIVHGDFNGDGYQDIAFSMMNGPSANYGDASGKLASWTCPTGSGVLTSSFCDTAPSPPPTGPFAAPTPGGQLLAHGYVVVFYGGPGGYQTPVNPSTGLAQDFPPIDETCNDLYVDCKPNAQNQSLTYSGLIGPNLRGQYGNMKSVYNTLFFFGNPGSGQYGVDTTKTACTPGTAGSTSAFTCTGSYIRNPLFYNDTVTGAPATALQNMFFGFSLTVADVNHDGIDDLIISQPYGSHVDWTGMNANDPSVLGGALLYGSTSTPDQANKGLVHIYYGALGAGVVAPSAAGMLGDQALGISGGGNPAANTAVFQLYPRYPASSGYPELDVNTNHNDYKRFFGMNMSSGDFNGDGIDDIVIASGNGQVYVYYGPICQLDNVSIGPGDLQQNMYNHHDQTCQTNIGTATGICGTATANAPTAVSCSQVNFNQVFTAGADSTSSANLITPVAISKPLYPQMIYVPGSAQTSYEGSTLVSMRPNRSPASTTVLNNPGNIDGDVGGTSDLVIGTNLMQDPNITSSSTILTGLGYIYFGHKSPVTSTDMSTLPGLYASGVATYNTALSTQTVGGVAYYFFNPVMLEPYTTDGTVNGFFQFQTTIGDVNGDGTGDLIMPTQRINVGADGNSNIVLGGGFKLFY